MGHISLLLLPLLFSGGLVFGASLGKAKTEPAQLEFPLLERDELVTTQEAWEHFGNRTAWQRCQDLYPLLAVGDLIELVGVVPVQALEDFVFQHWAVYSRQRNGVHFIVNYHLAPPHKGIVREEPLDEKFHNRTCRVNNRQDWIDAPFLPWLTVERARKYIGLKEYNLHDNNCEHLARWSRNGVRKSLQIIKRGKTDRVKRFHPIIENVKDSVVDAAHFVADGAKKKVVWVMDKVSNKHINKHYSDPCEQLDDDYERYKVLLTEDDVEPKGLSPINEADPKEFRTDTEIEDEYFCPAKIKH